MAPSVMHGMHKNHGDFAASFHDFPTLQESSLKLHVAKNDHPDREALVLHQMMQSRYLTFQRLGTNA